MKSRWEYSIIPTGNTWKSVEDRDGHTVAADFGMFEEAQEWLDVYLQGEED